MPGLLLRGSAGDDVIELQRLLNLCPSALPRLQLDGQFGPRTEARVREFQSDNALKPDGIVGKNTEEVLVLRTPEIVQEFRIGAMHQAYNADVQLHYAVRHAGSQLS
jgi:murein L,D-transpeptidase YcbB/YkuD